MENAFKSTEYCSDIDYVFIFNITKDSVDKGSVIEKCQVDLALKMAIQGLKVKIYNFGDYILNCECKLSNGSVTTDLINSDRKYYKRYMDIIDRAYEDIYNAKVVFFSVRGLESYRIIDSLQEILDCMSEDDINKGPLLVGLFDHIDNHNDLLESYATRIVNFTDQIICRDEDMFILLNMYGATTVRSLSDTEGFCTSQLIQVHPNGDVTGWTYGPHYDTDYICSGVEHKSVCTPVKDTEKAIYSMIYNYLIDASSKFRLEEELSDTVVADLKKAYEEYEKRNSKLRRKITELKLTGNIMLNES